ncbi:MAG: OmpA family protein [Bdellovibrionales bacterium]|nr:OmpA family protein [Bdellovibrionales bacterium]
MKAQTTKFRKNVKTISTIAVLSFMMAGCAHEITKKTPKLNPITISPTANAAEEISMHQALTDQAYANQVDVMAPTYFDESKNYLAKAKKQNDTGAASTEILKTLGYAQAYLLKANEDANAVRANMVEVSFAREQALKAGARSYPAALAPLDNKFKQFSTDYTHVTPEQKLALKNSYLNLELSTIKTVKLGQVKDMLTLAKNKGAAKIIPKAYQQAVQRYNIAETLIETDRHSNTKIGNAVTAATTSADRVMKLLASEQNSRNQTPEQRAMTLEARDNALIEADAIITEVAAESIQKDEVLAQQDEALTHSQDANKAHEKKANEDQIVTNAASQFNNNEADVYRQGDNLIIRLKSMNFASGRADLPSDSIAVLTKVKEVIKDIGPGAVMVEGHTDGVGAANINQQLSEKRAKSVMEFFATDKILGDNKMDSKGYGYSKPLATNKTKEGRAQNRRVDIVIKPNQEI